MQRGDETRGEMVGRGEMQHPRISQAVRPDAGCIHGHAQAGYASGGVDLPDFAIARVLYGIDLILTQQLQQQIVQKVRSRAQQDVFRVYVHAPKV